MAFRIVLINHSFQINYFSRRWELFAEEHPDVDVTLLAPAEYEWYKDKTYTYGLSNHIKATAFDHGNFHKRVFRMKSDKYRGWYSPDFKRLFSELKPDVIYHLGTHNMRSLEQILRIRDNKFKSSKVIAFSMRGPALNLRIKKDKCSPLKWCLRRIMYLYQKNRLNYINKHVDAFFCHYPDAIDCFRQEGYTGPIYMQTQVGVNGEWFHEDDAARKEIRDKYGISEGTYVFGSATRFTPDKGIDIILKALPTDGDWVYLMMGSGSDKDQERLRSIIEERNLQNKVIETGFVDWYEMTKYWNAVDCAIHVPLTTPNWEETFSLSAVQPMITGKPVIGSSSGSVPYQVGFSEMIVPEGDVEALREKLIWVLKHKEDAKHIGERMKDRSWNSFEIRHLNELFYRTIVEDVLCGKYDKAKIDMVNYEAEK